MNIDIYMLNLIFPFSLHFQGFYIFPSFPPFCLKRIQLTLKWYNIPTFTPGIGAVNIPARCKKSVYEQHMAIHNVLFKTALSSVRMDCIACKLSFMPELHCLCRCHPYVRSGALCVSSPAVGTEVHRTQKLFR